MKSIHTTKADEPTARDWLETVVSQETAADIIEHRRVKKCPITARAAKVIASELATISEDMRETAIDHWLNMGWQGFKADWIMRALSKRQKPVGYAAAAMNMIARNDEKGHDFSAFDNVKRLPTVAKH